MTGWPAFGGIMSVKSTRVYNLCELNASNYVDVNLELNYTIIVSVEVIKREDYSGALLWRRS